MTEADLIAGLRAALADVAPDLDVAAIDPAADLRSDLDIDSMDYLNFVIAVSQRFGVEIPEADYGQVATLQACARYLSAHVR
jgi:acyl carrier protein